MMYLLDPQRGRTRRARLQSALVHAAKRERDLLKRGLRDARHRAKGASERARRVFSEPVPDAVVLGRIRAQLGRAIAHARALDIDVRDGKAILGGAVLTAEAATVVRCVKAVPGVRDVVDRMERKVTAGANPALATEPHRPRIRSWTPAAQVGALGASAALIGYGLLKRGDLIGKLVAAAGGGLALRAVFNEPLPKLVTHRAEVMVQKTVVVHAPINKVFDLWSQLENLPRFMRHVRDIDLQVGGTRSMWTVDGPAGTAVHFEAETIELEPDRVIAWRTIPGQQIEHEGRVKFEELPDDTTRVTVRMTYKPPGGVIGHAIAHILGWDPKSRIDDDLVRMKALLEDPKRRPPRERYAHYH
ncbi:MAG: SRPBCC family protein [Deltaproteobacteria bacterium]|nr:SRPBCC family protein [Deltaproteobacteria bacterium]